MLLNVEVESIRECPLALDFSGVDAASGFKVFFSMDCCNFRIAFLALFGVLEMNGGGVASKSPERFTPSSKSGAR